MIRQLRFAVVFCALIVSSFAGAQNVPVIAAPNPLNAPVQQSKHYVVLVSLDGFRYDYPQKFGAPHLLALAKRGASTPWGMFPSYPSLTFPNHYTIVTGLYPEHHGIVGNSFYDPTSKRTYSYKKDSNTDGSFYGGLPLWSLAEQQGMRSASFFWPGSQADIHGRPAYYLQYQDNYPDEQRVDQVIAWLKLPPAERPHFITLYYPNVDHAGHTYGPDSEETRAAVHHVDELIGELSSKLDQLHLPVDLIIVADHGMTNVQGDWINLEDYADLTGIHTEGSLMYPETEAQAEKLYEQFKSHPSDKFSVYRRASMPAVLHFDTNPREGDPVIVPNGPYIFRAHPFATNPDRHNPGDHGYDAHTMPEMKAIFFAAGPDIKPGVTLPSFENTAIYPFVARILGLNAPVVDGTISPLLPALRKQ
jgi:predicted AlkP superfamily pyrophosphatase or phosphodiesterase